MVKLKYVNPLTGDLVDGSDLVALYMKEYGMSKATAMLQLGMQLSSSWVDDQIREVRK